MGWFGRYDWKTVKQAKQDVLNDWKESAKVLLSRSTSNKLWLALENKHGQRFVMLSLFEKHGDSWMEKSMSEDMHPFYYDCPLSVIEAAGPTNHKSAQEWRDKVLEYHERDKRKFAPGDKVEIFGKNYTVVNHLKGKSYFVQSDENGKGYRAYAKEMELK